MIALALSLGVSGKPYQLLTIIARLVGIRYFTRFNLVTAFNNLRMHPDS